MFPLSNENKQIARNIVEKLKIERQEKDDKLPIISFKYLYKILNKIEKEFVIDLLELSPKEYGFKGSFLGIKPVPLFLKRIKNQKYIEGGEEKEIAIQYLPLKIWHAYKKLNRAIQKDLEKQLLVKSGYRSPAYQALIFLYYLVEKYKFDHARTMSLVAIPGYSEHGYPPRQAIDFITQNETVWEDEVRFGETEEYKWLLKNANKYNFYLSYSKNNPWGVAFEPWHWHYKKSKIKMQK